MAAAEIQQAIRKKQDELNALQAVVMKEIIDRQNIETELDRLEDENRRLKAEIDSGVKARKARLADTKTAGSTTSGGIPALSTDPATAMEEKCATAMETASLVSASNLALRATIIATQLAAQRTILLDASKLNKSEKAEVDWVLKSAGTEANYEHVLNRNPFLMEGSNLSRVQTEFKSYFTAASLKEDMVTSPPPAASCLEDVNDSFHTNKTLHAELEANAKYDTSDEIVTDALQNYGFAEAHAVPYEFDEPDSMENIVMDVSGGPADRPAAASPAAGAAAAGAFGAGNAPPQQQNIKCATLNKLIERVTHEKYVDLNTRYVFLLTYHSFTTPRALLDKLAARYDVPIPPNLTADEIQLFKSTKLDRIQIRVCSVLKYWLEEHFTDYADDPQLKLHLQKLITSMLQKSASVLSTQLAKSLSAIVKKKEKLGTVKRTLNDSKTPKPLIPIAMKAEQFNFESASELEMARQLTLLDFDKFRSIQPRECLNQSWSKKDKDVRAPNIIGMTEQFNRVACWVQFVIVSQKDLTKRAAMFTRFINIAQACLELNNFNSLFAIYCGLTSNATHRLQRTKELIPAKVLKYFAHFKDLFAVDKNNRNLRRALASALTPCIPHLGIFLTDLTFTEDGNPDELLGMINFQKRMKLAERIRWIKQYQQEAYQLTPVPCVQDYYKNNLKIHDTEALWKMSKDVEQKMIE